MLVTDQIIWYKHLYYSKLFTLSKLSVHMNKMGIKKMLISSNPRTIHLVVPLVYVALRKKKSCQLKYEMPFRVVNMAGGKN